MHSVPLGLLVMVTLFVPLPYNPIFSVLMLNSLPTIYLQASPRNEFCLITRQEQTVIGDISRVRETS